MIFPIIDEIFESQAVIDSKGKPFPLEGNIDQDEGMFLYNLINNDTSIIKSLEVGCAFAISSLYICSALRERRNAQHIMIDPYQYGQYYQGIGILNLDRAGVDFYKIIAEGSEVVLPMLLKDGPGAFDMVFIDGFHSFDQVSLDFYYANRLVKVGGYIFFDDSTLRSVSRVIAYALRYPAYQLYSQVKEKSAFKRYLRFFGGLLPGFVYSSILPIRVSNFLNRIRFSRMVALQKIAEDKRENHWIMDF